jgi:hypothetical protein
LRPAKANSSEDAISIKTTRAKTTGGVAQAVECLLCKLKVLSSNPSPTKKFFESLPCHLSIQQHTKGTKTLAFLKQHSTWQMQTTSNKQRNDTQKSRVKKEEEKEQDQSVAVFCSVVREGLSDIQAKKL